MSREALVSTPEEYRKFVQESEEYSASLLEHIEDTARLISPRIQNFFIFNSILDLVKAECLIMEYEHLGDPDTIRIARQGAIDKQKRIADILVGEERLQGWYAEVEGCVHGLLSFSREVLPPDQFFKKAPLILDRVREWMDIYHPV